MVMIVMVVIWIILRTFMLTFRCVPVQSLWDYTITDKVCNINSDQFFLGTITTHFIMDIIILILPIIEVFRLRLKTGQKLAIGALFLLGTIFLSSYGKSSQPISRPSNAIKLTTLIRTNKDRDADETSSTHQLADVENGLHYHSGDSQRNEGVHTMISSEQSGSGPEFDTAGIHVRNDTVVEVKQVESKGFYRLE
ncbi:hypothetical protein J7337_012129 [Fusarium musae]|uniref:Rhodopsin domain-containing protein n=1 Tax=Fusarium musae TaxID=1042133 RepID=A0A9P8D8K9_9HYPO|nr:hypothetical protein J7337_012129 [Fusarium musae]KAG9497334.1 hypothetical protein J7337_012129 [Fusarium musae]